MYECHIVIYKRVISLKDAKSQENQLNPSSLQFINWQNTNYDLLQNEKISNRLGPGRRHHIPCEKLKMDSELTLKKAVVMIRQHE